MSLFTSSSKIFRRNTAIKKSRLFLFGLACLITIVFLGIELTLRLKTYGTAYVMDTNGWYQNLLSVRNRYQSVEVVFLGSSRVQMGISPDDFVNQMRKLNRPSRAHNFGLGGIHISGLIAYIEEKLFADIVVLEQIGLNFSCPVQEEDLNLYKKIRSRNYAGAFIEEALRRKIKKHMMFFRGGIIHSFFSKGFYKLESHDNGWLEGRHNHDPNLVERAKRDMDNTAIQSPLKEIPKGEARKNQNVYLRYFNTILSRGSRLVILRMPVGGETRKQEDELLSVPYHTDFISENKRILYIDANTHPLLSKYRPIDHSHLDAPDSENYSRDLAIIINAWLQ